MRTAIREGLRRVLAAPFLVFGLWLLGLLVALPAAWEVTSGIDDSVATRRASENLLRGFDMGWYEEYQERSRGMAATFTPTVAGAGGFYANLETWATGTFLQLPPGLLGLGLLWMVIWLAIQGGVVERLVHPEAVSGFGRLLATGGRFCFRFTRLFVLSALCYVLIYFLSRQAYEQVGEATRDVPAEGPVFLLSVVVLVVTAFLLALVQMIFAYAKIATVLDDRRSMFLAAVHGCRFVLMHPLRTVGLYAVLTLFLLGLLGLYAVAAPVAGPSGTVGIVVAFTAGQAYLMARVAMRLWLVAGQGALYRRFTRVLPPAGAMASGSTS